MKIKIKVKNSQSSDKLGVFQSYIKFVIDIRLIFPFEIVLITFLAHNNFNYSINNLAFSTKQSYTYQVSQTRNFPIL